MNYYFDHIEIEHQKQRHALNANFTGGEYFVLALTNLLLTIFTFGLATPWVIIRTTRFMFDHIALPGSLNLDQLAQTEANYSDATGEDLADVLDLGII
jgi:uncharacterized membrane protein YjgN (DUF898 family)